MDWWLLALALFVGLVQAVWQGLVAELVAVG